MKTSGYDNICTERTYLPEDLADNLEKQLVPILVNKYNGGEFDARLALLHQLLPLLSVTGGELKDKKILDLGCGSNNLSLEGGGIFDDRMFEPWLCRGLYELDFNPIGIDYGDLKDESFEHYQLNLLDDNSLGFLPDNSIDVANAKGLFSSPFLRNKVLNGLNSSEEELRKVLMPQLERIVKPEGWFIYMDH